MRTYHGVSYVFACVSLLFALAGNVAAASKQEYACISTSRGVFVYRVRPNGTLQPVADKPVLGPITQASVLADNRARILYAVWEDGGKLFTYNMNAHEKLTSVHNFPIKIDPDTLLTAIDGETHLLFLATNNHIAIYDAARPTHIRIRGSQPIPTDTQKMIVDQIEHRLLLFSWRRGTNGQPVGSKLWIYRINQTHQPILTQTACCSLDGMISNALYIPKYLIVGKWDNTLTVYKYDKHSPTGIVAVSVKPMPTSVKGSFPQQITYRKQGSFLYVGLYHITDSARHGPPASTIIGYHLSEDGQLHQLATEAKSYVPEPAPFVDGRARFLYVASQGGETIDTYRITRSGGLSGTLSRLRINSPMDIVFFNSQ